MPGPDGGDGIAAGSLETWACQSPGLSSPRCRSPAELLSFLPLCSRSTLMVLLFEAFSVDFLLVALAVVADGGCDAFGCNCHLHPHYLCRILGNCYDDSGADYCYINGVPLALDGGIVGDVDADVAVAGGGGKIVGGVVDGGDIDGVEAKRERRERSC